MIYFWILVYNLIVVPIGFIGFNLLALVNKKARAGVRGRIKSRVDLLNFIRKKSSRRETFLVHSASLGEFEQAKPVIRGLKALRPDILIVASFTSPSGFENAERMTEVDHYTYLPLDTYIGMRIFLHKIKPSKIIFVSYELWPNLLFLAIRYNIKTYLISARLRNIEFKSKPLLKSIMKTLYEMINNIYAISEKDERAFKNILGINKIRVLTLGDTRYDQVIERAKRRIKFNVKKIFDDGFVLICGSIWPQDARFLFPAIKGVMDKFDNFRVIIAPHEPTEYAIEMVRDWFSQYDIRVQTYTSLNGVSDSKVVVIDTIGLLAELYHQSNVAFIGGSFRGSIHNVMEPAVAGNPVIFGPYYKNSREAEQLLEVGGAFCCTNESEIYSLIFKFIVDEDFFLKSSKAASDFILNNLGASTKTVKEILELNENNN
ncbi:MAG: hypothetical protein H0Z29_04800 [Candidatus Marinimicrobia bacterium]|nr:hypothetical protein [Candidatus Neomarinimicrobiota bacterium]